MTTKELEEINRKRRWLEASLALIQMKLDCACIFGINTQNQVLYYEKEGYLPDGASDRYINYMNTGKK